MHGICVKIFVRGIVRAVKAGFKNLGCFRFLKTKQISKSPNFRFLGFQKLKNLKSEVRIFVFL